jgi:hypothetical protein
MSDASPVSGFAAIAERRKFRNIVQSLLNDLRAAQNRVADAIGDATVPSASAPAGDPTSAQTVRTLIADTDARCAQLAAHRTRVQQLEQELAAAEAARKVLLVKVAIGAGITILLAFLIL